MVKLLVNLKVATVLTVYGIETPVVPGTTEESHTLQQYLPFTVLKLIFIRPYGRVYHERCNSTYRLRY